ncbi:aromatic-ring-hydroxylating dioxygenase subunit beta [Bordetella pseudohinzii]|uniref:3-phenylpropionate dioxygenase n=1 Tax=Bordetella pseudohinzii TaxID=1331258 RepID=A0A0J6C548_9BORD|nr:3-phenylpropionate/cinnamic acid dioxygenase subunit beta [Bordetella pseudohinzii]ANY17324.1 3-phenylpropionate dioxygenase [Bordetella pseudohinzii]KMM24397.1 3-phenylpropionate dioxygenase [Bordetella pseudohinzii]KXA80421.1 3-phenylpropionate dioxygenase [Bordetella pseudohinzii]KXA80783.1 3-phenylpropionate dioxygenase [Bordetella pseudohinzii]CUI69045.1 Biphenyl dioxygenase subunit beta [Bordetella pseudohinzii]
MSTTSIPASLLLWWEVQQFLSHEAELLDSRRFDEWLGLFDEQARYRMPLARNVRRDRIATEEYTTEDQVAWIDESLPTLRQRVAQLKTGIHWAEEPASRTTHMVANIRVAESQEQDGRLSARVHSRFMLYQNRLQTETNVFVGKRSDLLVRQADGWRILDRQIHLDQNVLQAKALTVFF